MFGHHKRETRTNELSWDGCWVRTRKFRARLRASVSLNCSVAEASVRWLTHLDRRGHRARAPSGDRREAWGAQPRREGLQDPHQLFGPPSTLRYVEERLRLR